MSDEKLNLITSYELLLLIANNEINLDVCDLNINSLKIIPHTSASDSQSFFSELINSAIGNIVLPIAVKMFNSNNKELKYETALYQKITTDIINNNYSPNFISYVGYGCCSYDKILKQLNEHIKDKKIRTFLKENENQELCLLITEKAGNGLHFGFNSMLPVYSLKEFYKEDKNSDHIIPILFQLIYSLSVLARLRINHNDLHPNNILIMELPEYISMGFIVRNKKYQIKTKYTPYIFDWDTGYADELGNNPTIEKRRALGLKNDFASKFDLYILLCFLERQRSLPKGHDIVKHETFVHLEGKDQEEYLYIPISDSEYQQLSQFEYITNGDIPMYKLSGIQLKSIIGEKIDMLGKNITSVLFYLNKTKFGTFIQIAKDADCRMTVISSDFPTALEMLESDFSEYEVSEFDENTKYIYTLPKAISSRRIYVEN